MKVPSFYDTSTFDYYLDQRPPSSNEKFTDPKFPPNEKSILSKSETGAYLDKENWAKNASLLNFNEIEWKRLSEIYPDNTLIEDNIDLEDIRQGKIGNCYFLSSLAAMTDYPNLLAQVFKTKKQNEQCFWEIVLYINGKFQIVIIDDFIPVTKGTNEPYFSKPNNRELWVVLLEKAWAKINGGYVNIISGWPCNVLNCITGFSTTFIVHDNTTSKIEEIFEAIDTFDKTNRILCSSTKGDEGLEATGLVKGHVYIILGSVTLNGQNGTKVKLIKMKNPWGIKDWNGDYCATSPKWNDIEGKDSLDIESKDGSFYIEISDFVKYFLRTDICHVIYESKFKSAKIDDLSKPKVYNIVIEEDNSNFSVSLVKEQWRYNRALAGGAYPSSMILMKYTDDNKLTNFLGDYSSCDDCNIIQPSLSKGIYLLFVYIAYDHCSDPKPTEAYVKVICDKNFSVTAFEVEEPFELLNTIMISGIKEKKTLKDNELNYYIENNFSNSGIGYRLVINPLDNMYFKWKNNTTDIINMFMLPPYENETEFTFTVPQKGEVICLAMKKETYGSYCFNLKSSMRQFKSTEIPEKPQTTVDLAQIKSHTSTDFSYDYTTISLSDAKLRKTFTKEEINQLMVNELKKIDEKLMTELVAMKPLEDEKDLVWIYIKRENGYYIGEGKENPSSESSSVKFVREGRGAFRFNDDKMYFIGYWVNNTKEKEGKIFDGKDNLLFEGVFANGMKNGKGELKFLNGDRYVGNFVNDNREGAGVYYWKDGSRWEGDFKNNVMNGKGMYYGNDGDNYEANYVNGEYIG